MDNRMARQAIERKLETLKKGTESAFADPRFGEENDSTADNVCKVIESLTRILECPRSQRELLLAEIVTTIDRLNLSPDPNAFENLSESQARKLRGYSREQFAEFMGECEQTVASQRLASGDTAPPFCVSMFAEIEHNRFETEDYILSLDEKLSDWFAFLMLNAKEIQTILKMIDDAPWSGVALAQTMQGK